MSLQNFGSRIYLESRPQICLWKCEQIEQTCILDLGGISCANKKQNTFIFWLEGEQPHQDLLFLCYFFAKRSLFNTTTRRPGGPPSCKIAPSRLKGNRKTYIPCATQLSIFASLGISEGQLLVNISKSHNCFERYYPHNQSSNLFRLILNPPSSISFFVFLPSESKALKFFIFKMV